MIWIIIFNRKMVLREEITNKLTLNIKWQNIPAIGHIQSAIRIRIFSDIHNFLKMRLISLQADCLTQVGESIDMRERKRKGREFMVS